MTHNAAQMLTEAQIWTFVAGRLASLDSLYFNDKISKGEHQTSEAALRSWAQLETTYLIIRQRG